MDEKTMYDALAREAVRAAQGRSVPSGSEGILRS